MGDDRARLLARKAKIEEQLAQLAKAEARKREQDQQRRSVLAGRIVLDHATRDEAFGRMLMGILDQAITAPRDRALFGLASPVPTPAADGAAPIPAEGDRPAGADDPASQPAGYATETSNP